MSTASYTPACSAAQNADLGIQLGYITGNKLQFAAEQSKIIYDLCLQQVSACQIPARCIRVFNIILNQTVGYQKLEDHATTTRLQELTKIRHDHIGEAIRYLSRAKIIKWRKGGKYNNYLSINFNFSAWFNKDPDCTINNDPTLLLPEHYRRPVDEGLGADFMAENSLIESEFDQAPQADKTAITPPSSDKDSVSSTENSLDKASIIQIVKEVILQQFQNNPAVQSNPIDESKSHPVKVEKNEPTEPDSVDQPQIHPVEAKQIEQTESIDKSKQNTVLAVQESQDIDTEKDQQLAQYKAELEQSKADQAVLEQQLFERLEYGKTQAANFQDSQQRVSHLEQKTEQIQSKYERLQAKDISRHVNAQTNNNLQNPVNTTLSNLSLEELANLDYPSQLTPEERASIQVLVGKAGSREQDILNLLTIRLNNGTPPNNNVSYFASLVNRHRRGELDFSALSAFKSPKKVQEDKAIMAKLRDMIGEFRDHDIHRKHYEKGIEKNNVNGKIVLSGSDFDKKHYQNFYDLAYNAYYEIKAYVKQHQLDENIIAGL